MPGAPLITNASFDAGVLAAIDSWQGTPSQAATYREVQAALRGQDPDWTRNTAVTISALVRALERSTLNAAHTLYRGVRDADASFGGPLPSLAVDAPLRRRRFAGFVATTADPLVLEQFIPNRGVLIALHVPAGTSAVDIARWGHPERRDQREVLLPSDLEVEITDYGHGADICTSSMLADRLVVYLDVR